MELVKGGPLMAEKSRATSHTTTVNVGRWVDVEHVPSVPFRPTGSANNKQGEGIGGHEYLENRLCDQ
jgi:hypothetical protein